MRRSERRAPEWVKTPHPVPRLPTGMASPDDPTEDQYVITLRGVAGPAVRTVFADLEVTAIGETTVLAGVRPDQAALHGVLQRIQELGLEVVNVRRQP